MDRPRLSAIFDDRYKMAPVNGATFLFSEKFRQFYTASSKISNLRRSLKISEDSRIPRGWNFLTHFEEGLISENAENSPRRASDLPSSEFFNFELIILIFLKNGVAPFTQV